jgi:hypothetical protein
LILIAQSWIHVFLDTDEEQYLFMAVVFLERGLLNSNHNYQFKLLLIRLYAHFGLIRQLYNLYLSMDIKFIQNDILR